MFVKRFSESDFSEPLNSYVCVTVILGLCPGWTRLEFLSGYRIFWLEFRDFTRSRHINVDIVLSNRPQWPVSELLSTHHSWTSSRLIRATESLNNVRINRPMNLAVVNMCLVRRSLAFPYSNPFNIYFAIFMIAVFSLLCVWMYKFIKAS